MTIMWITLIAAFSLSLLSRSMSIPITTGHELSFRPNQFLVYLVAACLVSVAGLQKNVGDTVFYMYSYTLKKFSLENIEFEGDFGFSIYQMLLQKVSSDPQILIFFTALIVNSLIILTLSKYSRMFEISVYVYITAGMYITSMNGIRQFMASAICFTATKYIQNGNWIKYILVILFASTIHKSSLVLIPIYFIIRREAWSKVTFILLLLSVFIVLGFNQFSEVLFAALEDTQYGHYQNFNEGGANVMRAVVCGVPVVLAYMGRHRLKEVVPNSDYIVNMALLNFIIMLIATQNWILARFTIYLGLYSLILVSYIVKLFTEKDQKLIYYGLLLCYFIYFYYETVIGFNFDYRSDYINL